MQESGTGCRGNLSSKDHKHVEHFYQDEQDWEYPDDDGEEDTVSNASQKGRSGEGDL